MLASLCQGGFMRLYIAGLYASTFHINSKQYMRCSPNARALRDAVTHKLESYHYIKKGRFVEHLRKDKQKVFLDSGAFSAFTLGSTIDIEEYADYVKGHQDIIKMASVLDAIGDAEGTYHNLHKLEKLGAETLPCFHFGEPFSLCEYYLRNYEYITIGGMVPVPNGKLRIWLDELWNTVLTDKDGIARRKVHGFGLTARSLVERYPWYSVDSSTWVQAAATGTIVFPELKQPVAISARSPSKKDFAKHYDTLDEQSRAKVDYLLHYYGLTLEEVRDTYHGRWALNCFSFARSGELLGDDHWLKPFRIPVQNGLLP